MVRTHMHPRPQRTMQDTAVREIIDLLGLASDVKSRLRQLETLCTNGGGSELENRSAEMRAPDPTSFCRARNHLELALEALGTPTWGFAKAPPSTLQITGYYSSDIYKALNDLRQGKGRGTDDAEGEGHEDRRPGRRKADVESYEHARSSRREVDAVVDGGIETDVEVVAVTESDDGADTTTDDIATAPPAPDGGSSVWVKSRVDEIHRALTAAFGEDDLIPEEETPPKPFASPEFIGNTDTLSVPELIGFFQLQGKTGVLTIDARQEQFKLEYLRGELIHAASSSSPDGHRLGEVLVRLGHITEAKLSGLLEGKSDAERLGDALLRGDVVSDEALAQALEYQVQNIFHRLFDLGGCRFTFREGLEGEPRARVRYNVTRLLLETARHRDEQRKAG